MSNVLGDNKQQQIVALGRLGWSLRRIEQATGVRRETASGYLKAAGIVVRGCGRPSESKPKPAISPEVSTDPGASKPAISSEVSTDSRPPKPATRAGVSTDLAPVTLPGRAPSASACEPYRELISEALGRGRNATAIWQDLVDDHGFPGRYASVRRFVVKLRGASSPEARVVITTAPGEEGQVDYGDGPMVRHPHTGKYRFFEPRCHFCPPFLAVPVARRASSALALPWMPARLIHARAPGQSSRSRGSE